MTFSGQIFVWIDDFHSQNLAETDTDINLRMSRKSIIVRYVLHICPHRAIATYLNIFQEMRRAGNKGERLGLTDLLAKPHQRIPRYKLLIQVSRMEGVHYRVGQNLIIQIIIVCEQDYKRLRV